MANFLSALLSGVGALGGASQPGGLTPEWFSGVMGQPQPPQPAAPSGGLTPEWFSGVMGADAQPQSSLTPEWFSGLNIQPERLDNGGNPIPAGQPVNLLEGLGYETPNAGGNANAAAPQPARAPRERRTVLDSVGRIADVLARVGGAEALYQPTLDAREDRKLALEDRSRAVDMDKLKLSLAQQQVQGGQAELENAQTAKLGFAMRGLQAIQARGGDPNKAWPLLAQQMGVDPNTARVIGEQIASDPNAITGIAAAINGPTNGGDNFGLQPFYAKGPNGQVIAMQLGRDGRVQQIPLPEGFQPTDQLQVIDQGGSNVIIDKRTGQPVRVMPKEGGPVAGERPIVDGQGRVVGYAPVEGSNLEYTRENPRGGRNSTGTVLNPTQRGAVAQTRESIPGIRATLNRLEVLDKQMVDDGSYTRGYVGGLVPGQLVGGSAAEFDKTAALLTAQIRTLIRTAGEGSMSDFESRLALLPLPSRQDSDEGRREALNNIRGLLGEVEARSDRLLAQRPPQQQRPRPQGGQPQRRPTTQAPRRVQRPATGGPRVGAVQDGYRFKGGNPADQRNWEKVR